jgi:hypothetical protein
VDIENLYLDNKDVVAPTWGHGFTDTQRLKGDDVGSYYTTYFTGIINTEKEVYSADEREALDLPPLSGKEIYQAELEIANNEAELSKRLQKGRRLHFYPKHFKFYRCSTGIVRPEKFKELLGVFLDDGESFNLDYGQAYQVNKVYIKADSDGEKKLPEELNKIYKGTLIAKNREIFRFYTEITDENIVIAAKKRIYEQLRLEANKPKRGRGRPRKSEMPVV